MATAWTSAGDTSPLRVPATSPVPIADRVAAITEAGFCGLGLIAEAGLAHVEIELLERWWIPRGDPGHTYAVRDLLFEAADALGPVFVKIGSENGPPLSDRTALARPLRELAEQAVAHGTRVAIETMPFSVITTVPMGAAIVAATGHPAAGLIVDAWRVFRAGTPLNELRAALRPEMVFGVELDDAAPDVVGTLFEDTVNNRVLCGEGCFDLTGLVAALRQLGFDGPWGLEILSTSFRKLAVDQALKLAADSALKVLDPV